MEKAYKGDNISMKFKNILSLALSAAMLMTLAGCTSQDTQQTSVSALSQMEKINSKNIVDTSSDMRIWYEINPALFTDRITGAPGTLKSVIADIEYLSDGDEKTNEDLNMTGILLNDIYRQDDDYAPIEFSELNPSIGTPEDLQALCTRASALNMPVMMTLDLGNISTQNSQFLAMTELVNGLADGEDPFEKDPVLMDEFYVQKDHAEDGWVQIGSTPYYYQAMPQSQTPRINLDSQVWRQFLISAIEHFFSLGVNGFYIQDFNSLYPGDDQKAADFMKWFDSITKERNPNGINVFSYSSWSDPMSEIPVYAADNGAAGAEGMIAKAVTGAINARDLGNYLENQINQTQNMAAFFLNNEDGSLDLLKSEARLPQYKMALAIEMMLNGQIFLTCGDELGLTSKETGMIVDAIEGDSESEASGSESEDSGSSQVALEFGSMEEQKKDGNSILNFVQQAVLLRDSYQSIAHAPMTVSQELSTDQVLVLDRKTDSSETVLVFNLSDSQQTFDTTPILISDLPAELGGVLLTGDEEMTKTDNTLTLPPYSMALLK